MANCQCENSEHFGNKPGVHLFEDVKAVRKVNTPSGKRNSCAKCAKTHLKAFQGKDDTSDFFRKEDTAFR